MAKGTFDDTRESMTPFIAPPQDFAGDREALYRMTRRGRRIGSTQAHREGLDPSYTPGTGQQATATPRQTNDEWAANFKPDQMRGTFPTAPTPTPIGANPLAARRAAVATQRAEQSARFTNPAMTPEQNAESIASNQARIAGRALDPFAGMPRTASGAVQTPYGTAGRNWQAEIVAQHPDIGQAGTPANKEFARVFNTTQDRNAALAAANLARQGFTST